MSSPEASCGPPGFLAGVGELFLDHRGASVFPALAARLEELEPGAEGLVACPEAWGMYAFYVSGRGAAPGTPPGPARVMDTNEWSRLLAELGWSPGEGEVSGRLEGRLLRALVIQDGRAPAALLGWTLAEGAADPEAALSVLVQSSRVLRKFLLDRVAQSRKDSFRALTDESFSRSERRFRDFIENSTDMIYICDGAGTVSLVNHAGERLLGLSARDILGRPLKDFCPFAVDWDYFVERLAAEGSVRDFELTLQDSSGASVFVTQSATAVPGPDGSVREIHGIVRDITERMAAQRELWKANLELSELNETLKKTQLAMVRQEKLASIGQLAAGIAHEINNPLGFLRSDFRYLEGFKDDIEAVARPARAEGGPAGPGEAAGPAAPAAAARLAELAEELPSLLSEMEMGFRRIEEIVRNLGSFSRADEAGRRGPYDLAAGLEQALVIARSELRGLAEVERRYGAPCPVEANAGEIDQVLLNLVVNAAQALAAGGRGTGRIAVSTGSDESVAWAEVEDDGPGVPPEIAGRLFEPFFTTKAPGKGTGLGLSISYDIVARKHGGGLSFRPAEPRGTVFRLELPRGRERETR